ncbi:peptidoglycan bridge formation glycyltransferase FemA/FemB family protein [Candidatus Woesebacteria bacterium]|nr:peptidoglycan bridge formation glycyltransferase FemA/FemB family protein [Candidatus Woesebacteria bacterium]
MTHPLQTPAWADFRRKWGNEVVETPYGYITLHRLPFTSRKIGMFLKGEMPTKEMVEYLTTEGRRLGLAFIKIETNYVVKKGGMACADKEKAVTLLKKYGAVPGKTLFTPTTFWIDLTESEEDLLKSFHPKTRYNIRYAERKGVEVAQDNSETAFEKYLSLMKETVVRQKFFAHNEKYHRLMWEVLNKQQTINNKQPIARLLTAKSKGEIIAAWALFAYDGVLYYPYGASSSNPNHYRLMPSALLMWEAIKLGKRLGCHTFDLWGREPGKGFTKFKEGYNPQVIEFLGTWDLVINKKIYQLYRVAEKLRWLMLRLQAELGLTKYRF